MCVCVSKFENFSAFLATAIPTVSTPAQHRQVLLLLRKKEVQFNVMGWKADTGSRVKIQDTGVLEQDKNFRTGWKWQRCPSKFPC